MCFGILGEENAAQQMNAESSSLIINQIVQPQRFSWPLHEDCTYASIYLSEGESDRVSAL